MMFLLFLVGAEDETPEVNLQSGCNLLPLLGIMPAHGSCANDWPSSPSETPFLLNTTRLSGNERGNQIVADRCWAANKVDRVSVVCLRPHRGHWLISATTNQLGVL